MDGYKAGSLSDEICDKWTLSSEGSRILTQYEVGDLHDLQEDGRLISPGTGRSLGDTFHRCDSTSWVSHRISLAFSFLKLETAIPSLQVVGKTKQLL